MGFIENKLQLISSLINYDIDQLSLLGGTFGNLLFHYHYAKHTNKEEDYLHFEQELVSAIGQINKCESVRFGDGYAGIGWVLLYFESQGVFEDSLEEFLQEIDEVVVDNIAFYIKTKDYDYLHGLVGLALYLLGRKKYDEIAIIVDELATNAITDSHGIRWISSVIGEDNSVKEVYNISLAHGSAAVIIFFSKCVIAKQSFSSKTKKLMQEAIKFVMKQKLVNSIALFSGYCEINKPFNPNGYSRLAWCYGDMGIGNALWQAGIVLGDENLKQEAIDIYKHTIKRKTKRETGVVDAGLCHGTAGIAQMYYRMYFNTKIPEFKSAADYWIEETLKMAIFDDGLAGYKAWGENDWENAIGLLEGISGIGLALLSHESDEEPTWDASLLLS